MAENPPTDRPPQAPPRGRRRPYAAPMLADYGHVAERTLANMKASVNDAKFLNADMA